MSAISCWRSLVPVTLGLMSLACHASEQERDQLLAPGPEAGSSQGQGTKVAPALPAAHRPAAYRTHVARLEKKIEGRDFAIVVEPPFLVIGDESRPMVKKRAKETVRWAMDLLKKDFFPKDPPEILEIWLFKSRKSYLKHTLEIFGDQPTTPFGYYSPTHKALIMNIATGGGTLVHEIVHPFMAANFPGCPAWFNEGMGSLFEQCKEKNGHIVGLLNWRLTGLKTAIEKEELMSFRALTHTSTTQFYAAGSGLRYAQARYLLYYLQQQGLLRGYYRRFLANRNEDPTGYKTLQTILNEKDLDRFQVQWEAWVKALRYR